MPSSEHVKELLLKRIFESDENKVGGTHYQSEGHLGIVNFCDFVDTVLVITSLQDDIPHIEIRDFWSALREKMRTWERRFAQVWDSEEGYSGLRSAWFGGPGPLGGTESQASEYTHFSGIFHFKYLSSYFQFENPEPGAHSTAGIVIGWHEFSSNLDNRVLAKFKLEEHQDKLEVIFAFTEELLNDFRDDIAAKVSTSSIDCPLHGCKCVCHTDQAIDEPHNYDCCVWCNQCRKFVSSNRLPAHNKTCHKTP